MKKNFNRVLWGTLLLGAVAYAPMVWAAEASVQGAANVGKGMAVSGTAKVGLQEGISVATGKGFTLGDLNPFKGCSFDFGTWKGGNGFIPYHTPIIGYTFDVGSAASRILSTAVKYFLGDDTDLEAQLVWKKGCGGCGGCYKDTEANSCGSNLKFAAVLDEISVDSDIYREGTTVETDCVANLAQDRLDGCVVDEASLMELDARTWKMQYLAQRRSIQALTDALNMKRLYNNIKEVATQTPSDYSDYSAAVGSVASKRLLLDQLLALKKRVVAARVRLRAQTLELSSVDWKLVTTSPDLTLICKQ